MIPLRITMNKWFRLPQLGRDVFSDLMNAKVKYDAKYGFQFTSATNSQRAISVLSSALEEEVHITRTCFICDRTMDESIEEATICTECEDNESAFDLYKMKFAKLMESV